MKRRPLSVTIIGWLFIAAGGVGLAYQATEFVAKRPFDSELLWVAFVRLFAILCGAFLLRGSNLARWGLVAWLGYHFYLSVLHTLEALIVHGLLFAVVLYLLLRPQAAAFFRGSKEAVEESRPGETP